ncbi:hypothetical protein OS493_034277 [Desmophyllum pertusum]|uniref:GAIN-B domain-containing protein n=1 Tax=Desmophyllum pertusum TaxID=174260 RepID=A0A9W9YV99_9CNID|nr:hypothetical protein OS493_034277 [Desmophyllum pertusum]
MKHANKISQLNASEHSSLENAVNLTSKLLKDVSDIQNGDSNTNILVSAINWKKFVIQYVTLHLTSQNDSESEISIEQEEIGMTAMRIPADRKSDVVFPSAASSFNQSFIQEEKGAIRLPASLLLIEKGYKYSFSDYIMHHNARGSRLFTEDVIIKLTNTKKETTAVRSSCSFWISLLEQSLTGRGQKKGCLLVEETEEHTTCSCNHLTNFAVLLEVGETKLSDDHRFALEMMTYIGCSLSLVGEMLTILIYLVLMNLKSTQSHIRLNLVVCLVIAQLVFMAGINATAVKPLCIVVAITINYLYLVRFRLDGYGRSHVVLKGVPTVVVTSAVSTNILLNGNMNNVMRDDVCWFSFSSGFVWVFAGSVLAACLVHGQRILPSCQIEDWVQYRWKKAKSEGVCNPVPTVGDFSSSYSTSSEVKKSELRWKQRDTDGRLQEACQWQTKNPHSAENDRALGNKNMRL